MVSQTSEIAEMKTRILHLERILLTGDGDRLPLAEVVRSLTKTVGDYIAQKDKEEQHAREKAEAESAAKRAEWNRWKWLIIGIIVPALIALFGQAFIFYVKIYPIIEKLSQ